jgi:hypothetical protein
LKTSVSAHLPRGQVGGNNVGTRHAPAFAQQIW